MVNHVGEETTAKKVEEPIELDENGDPIVKEPDEFEILMQDIDSKTVESLESTRRMLSLAEESKDAGIRTLVMLDEQGEQLEKIDEGMDQINKDMRDAEKNLEGMEKCCGLCVLPWKRAKKFEEDKGTWKSNEDGQVNSDGPRVTVGDGAVMTSGYVTKITNDAREEEMENNLVEVGGMVSNLRNMAVDMGSEITNQNKLVETINSKATSNEVRISEANKRATKLLAS